MATLTVQRPSQAGATITLASATATDLWVNTGREYLLITNSDIATTTLTFDSPGTCDFGLAANAAHDLAVVVGAGVTKMVGPFSTNKFNDATGQIIFTTSNFTNCKLAVLSTS